MNCPYWKQGPWTRLTSELEGQLHRPKCVFYLFLLWNGHKCFNIVRIFFFLQETKPEFQSQLYVFSNYSTKLIHLAVPTSNFSPFCSFFTFKLRFSLSMHLIVASIGNLLQGWEETVVKQEQSNEGPLEIKIALPSIPSLYITSFLFQACQEIHRIGGHVLDKVVLQNFVWNLLDKV